MRFPIPQGRAAICSRRACGRKTGKSGDKVTIAGFGRFEMRERQTKNFTNPKTKVTSKLEPTAIPGFKASGRLKEKVSD